MDKRRKLDQEAIQKLNAQNPIKGGKTKPAEKPKSAAKLREEALVCLF